MERNWRCSKGTKSLGVNLKDSRIEVEKIIGRGSGFVAVEIPLPQGKKSFRIISRRGSSTRSQLYRYRTSILGLIREEEGVAVKESLKILLLILPK